MREQHIRIRQLDRKNVETKVHIHPTYIWDRIAAFVIDCIAIFWIADLFASPIKKQLDQSLLLENDGAMSVQMVLISLIYVCVFVVYHTAAIYFFKQTIGKKVFKIEVRSIWEGRSVTLYASFTRALLQLFSAGLIFFPFLSLFYDKKRRVLHDKITETFTFAHGRTSPEPTRSELLWVHVIYAVVLAHIALIGTFQYQSLKEKYSTVSELVTHPDYLCEDVTIARDSWSRLEESRLDVALSLYNANMIDEECLGVEAQRSISFEEEQDKAYFAMGLIHQGSAELSASYIEKVCEYNTTGESCMLIQLLEAFSSQNYELSNRILTKWSGDMSTYASLIAMRQFYFEKKFKLASEKIEELWDVVPLKKYLSMYRTLVHYELKNYEKAQEAFILTYPDLDFDQQKVLSALVCEKETENSCLHSVSKSCKKLEENIVESELGELSEKEFVSYLKYASCPDIEMTDAIEILSSKVETQEQVALIGAFRAEQQGRYEVERELLEQILSDGEEDSDIVLQARLMLMKRTYDVAKLKEFIKSWESLSPFHPHYFAIGMGLFNQFVQIKNVDLAMQVGQFLELSYQDHPELKIANLKLFKLNHDDSSTGKMEIRLPASEKTKSQGEE